MSLILENKPQILNLHVKLSQKEKDWFGEKKKKKSQWLENGDQQLMEKESKEKILHWESLFSVKFICNGLLSI